MALSTYMTFLMYKEKTGSTYSKLVDIKNVPALGAERNTIDITSLSDDTEQILPGIKRVGSGYQFNANYNQATYDAINDMDGNEYNFAIWKGGTGSGSDVTPDGSDGKWKFDGRVTIGTAEGGVDDAFDMVVTVFPSSPIDFEAGDVTGATGSTGSGL